MVYCSFIENFGYRQMMSWWRLQGTIEWLLGTESKWGEMKRDAGWDDADEPEVHEKLEPPRIPALEADSPGPGKEAVKTSN